jgi:ribosomal protein S18 acetylase RimI-like enzyme
VQTEIEIEIADPRDADARYCLRSFFEELGRRFDGGFDPAASISAGDAEMTLPAGLMLVATRAGSPVGCGALKFHRDTGIAEVKRMWVAPAVRGLGVGRSVLDRLVREASAHGMACLRLETNSALHEALHLYKAAGFAEVEPFSDETYAHHWFQLDL